MVFTHIVTVCNNNSAAFVHGGIYLIILHNNFRTKMKKEIMSCRTNNLVVKNYCSICI